jgi:hypothetical protein
MSGLPSEETQPLLCEHCKQPVEESIPCQCGDQEVSVRQKPDCSCDWPVFVDPACELHGAHQYHGWPGDGSGEDDLADFNQNEADDYRDE